MQTSQGPQACSLQAKQRISQAREPVVRLCDSVRFHETWDVLGAKRRGDPKHEAKGKQPDLTVTSGAPFIGHSRKGNPIGSDNPLGVAVGAGRGAGVDDQLLKELEGIFRRERNRMTILVVVARL